MYLYSDKKPSGMLVPPSYLQVAHCGMWAETRQGGSSVFAQWTRGDICNEGDSKMSPSTTTKRIVTCPMCGGKVLVREFSCHTITCRGKDFIVNDKNLKQPIEVKSKEEEES